MTRPTFEGEIMTEVVLNLSPEHLRNMANQIEADPQSDPIQTAEELRQAAAAIERGESFSVVRPAYKVTWAPKGNA